LMAGIARYVAVLDACVLYPAPVRDLLLSLADADLYHAKRTDGIQHEWGQTSILRIVWSTPFALSKLFTPRMQGDIEKQGYGEDSIVAISCFISLLAEPLGWALVQNAIFNPLIIKNKITFSWEVLKGFTHTNPSILQYLIRKFQAYLNVEGLLLGLLTPHPEFQCWIRRFQL
jgi:hypothetical protein